MPEPPFARRHGMDAVLSAWTMAGALSRSVVVEQIVPGTEARSEPLPDMLGAPLIKALLGRGIDSLYCHQIQALRHAAAGRHVVVATPTASGKSLCFHLPVLSELAKGPGATALYLYPTKALSRDQEHGLCRLIGEAELSLSANVYDGDTPGDSRRVARERSRIVLSNPDMLHSAILPNHAKWARFFQGLTWVVLDELHTYRGVFGSHMAHVLARLNRVARYHGASPRFLCATATIGNPREHAARLLGVEPQAVAVVEENGAPSASRHLFIYNPPVVNAELGIRESTLKHSVKVAGDLIEARVPTILFGPSRNSVEVMLKYLRDRCAAWAAPEAIMGYRGGYLPETRRRVEAGLREGTIVGVVATNALELGIDIGDLDAVVLAGYPGSVAATWQRFGRAGRRGKSSVAVLVCSSDPVDQYLARDPSYLLRAGAEHARIDPSNVEVLIQHLKCAAFEAPFEFNARGPRLASPEPASGEAYLSLDSEATRDALDYLARHHLVHESAGRYYYTGESFPANNVSLRNIGWDNFVIVEVDTGQSLAELDFRAAHTMLHEQAIYQHDAEQYQVERLDYDNHKAFVRKVEPDYFTTALTYRSVSVIEPMANGTLGAAHLGLGEVKVLEKVTGYKKIKFFTHENAGYGDVHLPEMQMHTTSFWLTVPESMLASLRMARPAVVAALGGIGKALEAVACLSLMCDPRDINRTIGDGWGDQKAPGRDPFAHRTGGFDPTLFLFDAVPGGVGLAAAIFERANELLERTSASIRSCSCQGGCPACVGPALDSDDARRSALYLLDAIRSTPSLAAGDATR